MRHYQILLLALILFMVSMPQAEAQRSRSRSHSWSQSSSWSTSNGDNTLDRLTMSKHEVKLNLLNSILLLRPEVAYEYSINNDISAGVRLAFSLKKDEEARSMGNFRGMPYFRWNFYRGLLGRQDLNSARGFFIEVNSAFTSYPTYEYDSNRYYPLESEKITAKGGFGFGLGTSLGYKWIAPSGWVFEFCGTLGRNFVHPSDHPFYAGSGLNIGYRF